MSDTVRVAKMRLHRARNGSSDGHAAVRALDLAPPVPDRSVLVIRRLSVPAADPRTAREHVAALLRDAARPALGPVAPDCAAVLFSDEVEAMSCLTTDLVTGRAADRWYWPTPTWTGSAGIGAALTRLWLDRPSWVPAMLAHLARRSQPDAVRAVGLLSDPQARAVLDALLAAFRDPVVSPEPPTRDDDGPTPVPDRPLALPSRWGAGGADLRPVGRALLMLGLTLAVTPSAARSSRLRREVDNLLLSGNTSRPVNDNRSAVPDQIGTRPVNDPVRWPVDAPAGNRSTASDRTGSRSADDPVRSPVDVSVGNRPTASDRTGSRSADDAVRWPVDAPGGTRSAAPDQVGNRSAGDAARRPVDASAVPRRPAANDVEPEPTRHRWDGWGTAVESRFATFFYAVNLMTRLDLPRVDSLEPESGWATLEALGRSLLPTACTTEPTTEHQDPIWRILAELDGRDPSTPTPVRLGALTHRLHGLLERHRLAPEVFAQPGTLVVGRTHIDVVLGLHQIDLAARSSGLDHDPGWVPALGRIIAYHFDGGS
jgi:hypothetical protein